MKIDEFTTEDFTPEDLERFENGAEEARAGYDLAELLKTKPYTVHPQNWHPEKWGQTVQFRYDRERLAALDQTAKAAGKTRSQVLREAADAYVAAATGAS